MMLRTVRQGKHLTQEQLADLVGVDQTTISDLESGKNRNPSWRTVCRLARALDVAPDAIFPIETTDSDHGQAVAS